MIADTNKELVRQYIELYNSGHMMIANKIIAPDFVDHAHPEAEPGTGAVKRLVRVFRAAFPDAVAEVAQVIAEGDTMAFRFIIRGTHSGTVPFAGLPPTGTPITLIGMDFVRIAAGKVRIAAGKMVELWSCQDTLGLLQQLAVMPPLDPG